MQFYEKYVNLCNSVNKSPSAVAEEIGLTAAAATGWGQGAKPRKATLLKLANYFGVPLEAVASDKESPAENDEAEMVASTPAEKYLLGLLQGASEEEQSRLVELVRAALKMQGLQK